MVESQPTPASPPLVRGSESRRAAITLAVTAALVLVGSLVLAVVLPTASDDDLITRFIRLTIMIGIPTVLIVLYWLIARGQVRRATAVARDRDAAERDVIARVSHQLRDRLTVVYGFSETLLDSDLSDTTEIRDILTVINTEAVDLGRIVDDLVITTELESDTFDLSPVRFDPAAEVERVVVPFRRRGHEVAVDCWSGAAFSDAIRFRHIIRSLISNAVLHGGSEIAVIGELIPGEFRCTIADDGPGLSSDVEARMFQTTPLGPPPLAGMTQPGLGLSVAIAIASRLGGSVSYERSDERLTMVTLSLPTTDWPDAIEDVPESPSSPIEGDVERPSAEQGVEPDPGVDRVQAEHRIAFGSDGPEQQSALASSDDDPEPPDHEPAPEAHDVSEVQAGSM